MKNITTFIIWLSFFSFCITNFCIATDNLSGGKATTSSTSTLNISSDHELKSLTASWIAAYNKVNPTLKINLDDLTGNELNTGENLRFVSNNHSEVLTNGTNWKMVIGRDAIVLIINAKNPMMSEIYRQGISVEEFTHFFNDHGKRNWNNMLSGGQNQTIKCYITDNEAIKTKIATFANTNSATIDGLNLATAPEIVTAVENDLYAIGFCKLSDVRDASTNTLIQNIKLIPIDKNQNHRIDYFENIYENMDAFTRGVWIGKYPRALCGSIYAISSTKPTDQNALAFLTWVTTSGQKYLNQNGYSDLASVEVKSNMEALSTSKLTQVESGNQSYFSRVWLIGLFSFFLFVLVAILLDRHMKKRVSSESDEEIAIVSELNVSSILAPKGVYFDKTHTWAYMEKDGTVKVGIDDFLQHITGTITRINMKEPGEKIRKGEKIITIIRNGKQLNIYAPISGTIKDHNQTLKSDSALINSAPFTEGWIYQLEPKNWLREIQFLFMVEKYKKWLDDEFSRLKDFFAASVRSNSLVYEHIILQDGGELTDNVLADLGPEVWEDFQTKFIDTSK